MNEITDGLEVKILSVSISNAAAFGGFGRVMIRASRITDVVIVDEFQASGSFEKLRRYEIGWRSPLPGDRGERRLSHLRFEIRHRHRDSMAVVSSHES